MLELRTWLSVFLSVCVASAMFAVGCATAQTADPSKANFWRDGDPGELLHLRARVLSADGSPVAGAEVELRQADGNATYHPERFQGVVLTAPDGSFELKSVLPGQYSSAKHIHVAVSHPGHQTLITEILFRGDPNLVGANAHGIEVLLEEVRTAGTTVLVGGVELVLQPR